MQEILCQREGCQGLPAFLQKQGCRKALLVCGKSFQRSEAFLRFRESGFPFVLFDGFTPNPDVNEVKAGIRLFLKEGCDSLLAVGGGSAMDVAKCIKAFSPLKEEEYFCKERYRDTKLPFVAVPTTAGTGSEATHFAVVYREGVKQSVAHPSLIPNGVILDAALLLSLPPYQKSCSMMDALCQAIESHWSRRVSEESRAYSQEAIREILRHGESFVFENDPEAAEKILWAAHLAGRAINLTTTTAPHAMSYQLTKLYSLPHGHSVSLCLVPVWERMLADTSLPEKTKQELSLIAKAFGEPSPKEALHRFQSLIKRFGFASPKAKCREEELLHLSASVNPARLQNHPADFSQETLRSFYERILQ